MICIKAIARPNADTAAIDAGEFVASKQPPVITFMAAATTRSNHSRFLAMCREEPFRVFFPLGLANGIIGLALWPLHLWGALEAYPGVMHSRLMIEGFMAAFIVGFLGTAGPRLLSATHFTARELGALIALHLATSAAHLAGHSTVGDALFCAELVAVTIMLGRRFIARVDLPPPNFLLVGCGLLCGIAGAAIVAFATALAEWPRLYTFGMLAFTQGLVLLPILGVGVFLFPRFLSVPFGAELGHLRQLTPGWKHQAFLAAAVAAVIVASFAVESAGFFRTAGAVRFLSVGGYTATNVPSVLKLGRVVSIGLCIRAAVWMLLLGLLWPVFLPGYRVAGLHLVFIGGFMLTVFAVATRVILGHSGEGDLCKKRLPFLITAAVLLLIGLLARVGADFMPTVGGRTSHLIWAALLCIAAAIVWGVRLVPRVVIPDSDE